MMPGRMVATVAAGTGAGPGIGGRPGVRSGRREGRGGRCLDRGDDETVRMIRDAGGEATVVATDVSRSAEIAVMINRAVETFGRLDYAF
jgi:NAD(P)-dependent dehydrogenase (short-subunit alcohol dehydrogenase family)